MRTSLSLLPVVALLALAACGGAPEAKAPQPTDQATRGQELYAQNCAACHGDHGEGSKDVPAVVGKAALPLDPPPGAKVRRSQFHTAKDVFDFVKANMPPKKGGSLTDEQYAAILAFDLKANGVDLGGKQVDAASASSIVLHP